MTKHQVLTLVLILVLVGCRQAQKTDSFSNYDTAVMSVDNSDKVIYDFMRIVITEQKLHWSYGLSVFPEKNCSLANDSDYLKTLVVAPQKKEKKNAPEVRIKTKPAKGDSIHVPEVLMTIPPETYNLGESELVKCFSKEDVDHMLRQKQEHSGFMWDYSKLPFNRSNIDNWYCFSVPLFSKDSTKAIVLIRSLCPGLCGSGTTVIFKKQNNIWTSQPADQWFH